MVPVSWRRYTLNSDRRLAVDRHRDRVVRREKRRTAEGRAEVEVDLWPSRRCPPSTRCRYCWPAPSRRATRRPTFETRLVRSRMPSVPPRKLRVVHAARAAEAVVGAVADPAPDPVPLGLVDLHQKRHRIRVRAERGRIDVDRREAEEVRAVQIALALEQLVLRVAGGPAAHEQIAHHVGLDPLGAHPP